MNKNLNVTILNLLRYEEKDKKTGAKTGKEKIRIGYVLLDKDSMQDKDKFKGLAELSYFLDFKEEIWNKLTLKFISQPVSFVFEQAQSERDPLKSYFKLISIDSKDESISLV